MFLLGAVVTCMAHTLEPKTHRNSSPQQYMVVATTLVLCARRRGSAGDVWTRTLDFHSRTLRRRCGYKAPQTCYENVLSPWGGTDVGVGY